MGARRKLNRRQMVLHCLAAPWLLAGCSRTTVLPSDAAAPPPTLRATQLVPTATSIPPPASSIPETPDTGWVQGDAGVEVRHMRVAITEQKSAPVVIARIDPTLVHMRVVYHPDKPVALRTWFAAERPLIAINAGYFNADYQSSALVVSAGEASGETYSGFGGMLAAYADQRLELRALRDQPYDSAEPIVQAIQSAPMLVFPDGIVAEVEENGERARRTVVALDTTGNLLLIVAPTSAFTLSDIGRWLVASDLQIDRALNLDGGSSSGMFIDSGGIQESIDSFTALPTVVLIHR